MKTIIEAPDARMQRDAGAVASYSSDGWGVDCMRANQQNCTCVVVNVHGQTLTAYHASLPSMASMQTFLQKELSLAGQQFDISDGNGRAISTDGELWTAIESAVPLTAALAETSVHYIENRREELSQLQWKLMRDQIAGVAEKLVQVGHQVQELAESLANTKHEQEQTNRRFKHEVGDLINAAREAAKQDNLQLGERVEAAYQTIGAERNRREVAIQGCEQQIQGLRDMLSGDRSTRRTELAATNARLDDEKYALLEEGRCRALLEARHTDDFNMLTERIDALATLQAEQVQDLGEQVRTVAINVNQSLQDGTRSVLQVQSIAEATQIEAAGRLKKMEERFPGIEAKISEVGNRQMAHYDELLTKNRKLYVVLEQLRLEERAKALGLRRQQVCGEDTEIAPKASPVSPSISATMFSEDVANYLTEAGASGMAGNTVPSPIPDSRCPTAEQKQASFRSSQATSFISAELLEENKEAGSAAVGPRRSSPHFRSASVAPSDAAARSLSPPVRAIASRQMTSSSLTAPSSQPLLEDRSRQESFSSLTAPASPSVFAAMQVAANTVAPAAQMPQALRLPPRSLSPVTRYAPVATQPPTISTATPAEAAAGGAMRAASLRQPSVPRRHSQGNGLF